MKTDQDIDTTINITGDAEVDARTIASELEAVLRDATLDEINSYTLRLASAMVEAVSRPSA